MLLQAELWFDPCGGYLSPVKANATDPSGCCPLDSSCTIWNENFWRCVPDHYEGPTRGPSLPLPPPAPLGSSPPPPGAIPEDITCETNEFISDNGACTACPAGSTSAGGAAVVCECPAGPNAHASLPWSPELGCGEHSAAAAVTLLLPCLVCMMYAT